MTDTWTLTTPPTAEPIDAIEAKLHLRVDTTADNTLIGILIAMARRYCEGVQGRRYVTQTWQLLRDNFARVMVLPGAPLQSVSSITYIDTASASQTLTATLYDVDTTTEPGQVVQGYNDTYPTVRGHHQDVAINYVCGYLTPITSTFATDLLTASGRTFTDADIIRLSNSGGALPAPLAAYTDYHVRDVSGSTFKLAATAGGAAVTLTDDGTGTHFVGVLPEPMRQAMLLLIGHLYEHREAATDGQAITNVPLAVESLLQMQRLFPAVL